MITEDYVSFETAKLLKEKGFDEDIITYRDDFIQHGNIVIPLQECLSKDKIKTPTLQMAMKWLREVHKMYMYAAHDSMENTWFARVYNDYKSLYDVDNCSTYEEACESAIKYCLKNLIKNENEEEDSDIPVPKTVDEPTVPKLYPNGNYNKTWSNEDMDNYL